MEEEIEVMLGSARILIPREDAEALFKVLRSNLFPGVTTPGFDTEVATIGEGMAIFGNPAAIKSVVERLNELERWRGFKRSFLEKHGPGMRTRLRATILRQQEWKTEAELMAEHANEVYGHNERTSGVLIPFRMRADEYTKAIEIEEALLEVANLMEEL